jgi:hypothetical protein
LPSINVVAVDIVVVEVVVTIVIIIVVDVDAAAAPIAVTPTAPPSAPGSCPQCNSRAPCQGRPGHISWIGIRIIGVGRRRSPVNNLGIV